MALEATIRRTEVLVDGKVVHTAGTMSQADALADWINFQLKTHPLDEILAMMRGEPVGPEPAPKKKKRAPKRAEPEPEVLAEAVTVDGAALEGTITALKKRLATGDLDEQLSLLLAAEKAGRNRRGAIAAIEDRIEST